MNWDDLKFCLALHRYGTMSEAAKHLNSNAATVSRRIERLSHLNSEPLFVKDGPKWTPSTFADQLADLATEIEERLQMDGPLVQPNTPEQRKIKVAAPVLIMQMGYLHNIWKLLRNRPHLSLHADIKKASLAYGEADLALSLDEPREGKIIRRAISQEVWRVYGAKKFSNRYEGWARVVEENVPADTIYDSLRKHFGKEESFSVVGVNLMRDVIQNAPLMSLFPERFGDQHDDLHCVQTFGSIKTTVWLSYHYTRRNDKTLRELIDTIVATTIMRKNEKQAL